MRTKKTTSFRKQQPQLTFEQCAECGKVLFDFEAINGTKCMACTRKDKFKQLSEQPNWIELEREEIQMNGEPFYRLLVLTKEMKHEHVTIDRNGTILHQTPIQ
jgi:hypothetical protein